MDLVITSKQNNLVKYIRSLRDKRTRDGEKRILLEGVKMISEAVASGVIPEKIVVSERVREMPQVRSLTARCGKVPVTAVSEAVMDYLCETDTPQGIAAIVENPDSGLSGINITADSLVVVLDSIQDPGNVGTIVRTADAFGAQAVIMTRGCADLYGSKTLRATMGSVFHIATAREVLRPELTAFLRDNGVYTAATGIGTNAQPLHEAHMRRPMAIVLGNEAGGVSSEMTDFADIVIKISMAGLAESLNVAVAAGVVLYEAFRQRTSGGKSNL